MKSLRGYLRTKYLQLRLERSPIVIETPVPGTEVKVSFAVHTWVEYHNRAQISYTGEPDMVEWLKNTLRPGDVLWDVGANVGAYSILAAKLCRDTRVFSFEPFIPTFSHLWENINLNEVTTQVFPFCVGISDHTSLESLAVSDPRAGSSEHQVGQTGGKVQQGVIAARGDDLCGLLGLAPPTMLKLDIDGLEVAAMEGFGETLRRPQLRSVMIEVQEGRSEDPVQRICDAAGLKRAPNPLTRPENGTFNALFERPV
jgi:FkbM family methyltransferase